MTVLELKQLLNQLPDDHNDRPVVVETRFKTGYDEGDIYHAEIKSVSSDVAYRYNPPTTNHQVLVTLGGSRLVGGW